MYRGLATGGLPPSRVTSEECAARRRKKRAVVTPGYTLLVIVYHLLRKGATHQELGDDFLDRSYPDRFANRLVKRLAQIGPCVTFQRPESGDPGIFRMGRLRVVPPRLHPGEYRRPFRQRPVATRDPNRD